jgi:2-phospho-L-lactate guanylyltransferase
VSGAVWAVLPVKSFARGKSRLRPALADDERAALARRMCEHVLATTRDVHELAGTLVITDGDDVAALAERAGAVVLRDPSSDATLAGVVDAALASLEARGASAALVLMADLPDILPDDLHEVLRELATHEVVVVPDHSGSFTNALALKLGCGYTSCFGSAGSAQRHLARAESLGLRARSIRNPRIALDVDTPDAVTSAARWPRHA